MKLPSLSVWKLLGLLLLGGAFASDSYAAEGPPVITTQPASAAVVQGNPVTFSVVVSGTMPFSYQWRRDGGDIPGATGSSYTLPVTTANDNNAVFSVFVMNSMGNTSSANATLRVDPGVLVTSTINVVPISTQNWRYYTNGGDLGTAWKEINYADGAWPVGQSLFGVEVAGTYPEAIRTPFTAYTQTITTYWFRTHFNFNPPGNVAGVSLSLSANVDDGGVFYLNGEEFYRIRLPVGQTAATYATGDNEGATETFVFTPTSLVVGDNVLAVEVHQQSSASSDVVLGMGLTATVTNRIPDMEPPVVTAINPLPGVTLVSLNEIEVFFSEEVQGVDPFDLLINAQPATAVFHEGPAQYRFAFTQPATGVVQVAWAADNSITDLAPMPNPFAGGAWTYTLDPNARATDVRISEFMALNQNGIRDEDGDHSDWLELHNASPVSADLGGWFLTDDAFEPTRWRIPNGTFLGPDSYLLIWASGKPGRTNPAAPMHTNFRLNVAGEYLALLNPMTNVVSAFAPLYPEQRLDVSYGRDRLDPDSVGYYSTPTPGAANATSGGPDFAPDIVFSRQSGTFVSPFNLALALSTPSPNAIIRLEVITNLALATRNNVLTNHATTNSPAYAGPITIPHTTQIRARAFEPGKLPGTPVTVSYVQISPNVLGWSSDLPLCVIHVLSAGSISSAGDQAGIFMTFDNDCGRTSLTNVPSLHTRAGVNTRGASTGGQAKSMFAIETWDEFNQDADKPVLGMPPESDWVLYGINGFDTGLMHNPIFQWFGRQLGQFTSRTRYVEVFRKIDGGPVTTNDYFGLYLLEEKPKRNRNRVNITPLQPEDTNAPAITGGYMLRIDRTGAGNGDPTEVFFNPPQIGAIRPTPAPIIYDYPKITTTTTDPRVLSQAAYIRNYLFNFITNLSQPSTTDPIAGYAQYIDPDQWVDNLIAHIICFDVNAYRLGGTFVKDRNKRMELGPYWDCDRCLGTGGTVTPQADNRCFNPRLWRLPAFDTGTDNGTDFFGVSFVGLSWFTPLFRDPEFWQKFIDRYQALRTNEFSTNAILTMIDGLHNQVREAQVREQARWGATANLTWPRSGIQTVQGYTFDFGPATNFGRGAFVKEVEFQKKWLVDRLDFLDTNFLARPILSSGTAPVSPGATVIVTPAAKPNTLLLYTLNGTDPRLPGGAVSPSARTNVGPLTLTISNNVRLVARSYNTSHANQTNGPLNEVGKPLINSFWSGPAAATYYTTVPPLRITEIMYHPADPPPGNNVDQDLFEYIEVKNISGAPLDITGFRIRGGVDFDFPTMVLAAGQQVVVVRDIAAFRSRYGMAPVIAGAYPNDNLANDGDNLRLEGLLREPILDFRYDDRWYPSTDGAGFALQIVSDNLPTTSWGLKSSWRASLGTPGAPDPGAPPILPVYINEALTHTVPPAVDAIELYNPNGSQVNISGWFLTDDFGSPKKYRLPSPTIIPANGYLVLQANTSFGSSFLLSSRGDELYLFSGDANTDLTGYVHGFDFGPQATNVTFGRYVISTGEDHFPAQTTPTLGGPNAGPKVGPFVISEINYHPVDLTTIEGPRDNQKDEYIELENITQSNQPLYDPANPANTWRLRDAVTFKFPTGMDIPPGGHVLVVSFDPMLDPAAADAFRARNGAFPGAPMLGPFSGRLDNSSASVELVRPATLLPGGEADEILIDRVRYANTEPWPPEADGLGLSLQRRVSSAYGNDPTNWVGDIKTPGLSYGGGNGPVITMQPQSIAVLGTTMAQFSVMATGAPPIFYQWYFNNIGIPGATSSIYIIPSVQPEHAGEYRCLVQNTGGGTVSSAATLTYIAPAQITFHPTNVIIRVPPDPQVLMSNRTAYFRVAATTTHPPLSYQWLKNNTNIPAAVNPTAVSPLLTISNVVLADEGVYKCAVTDGAGTAFSGSATLTPWIAPMFLIPPVPNQTNPVATAFTVSSVVTGHPPPYTIFYRSNSTLVGRTDSSNHASFFTYPANFASRQVASNWYRLVLSNVASYGQGVAAHTTNHTRADFDMDGLPDAFEVLYGLNTNDMSDATGDLDGDKMSNLAEFIAGTDPSDPASYLKIEQNTVPGTATLFFGAAPGKTYTIQYTDRLPASPANWNRLADFVARTTARVETVTDPNWSTNRFYRVATPRVP